MHGPASQPTAFDIYRKLDKEFSLSNAFTELADLAISSISASQYQEAVSILNRLKGCVVQAKNIVDGHPETLITHVMKIKVLEHENCELRLELARLSGNEDEISMCEDELKQFDLYVAGATADLAG